MAKNNESSKNKKKISKVRPEPVMPGAAGNPNCFECGGSGLFANVANNKRITAPAGFVVVERCDSCVKYDNDLVAARAWGSSAIWQLSDDGESTQAICRPPTGSDPNPAELVVNAGDLLYTFANDFGRLAVSQDNLRRTIFALASPLKALIDVGSAASVTNNAAELQKRLDARDQEWVAAVIMDDFFVRYSAHKPKTPMEARLWLEAEASLTRRHFRRAKQRRKRQLKKQSQKLAKLKQVILQVHETLDQLPVASGLSQPEAAGKMQERLSSLLAYVKRLQQETRFYPYEGQAGGQPGG